MSELNIHLHVWRQPGPQAEGKFVHYDIKVTEHASFLEMLDFEYVKPSQRSYK